MLGFTPSGGVTVQSDGLTTLCNNKRDWYMYIEPVLPVRTPPPQGRITLSNFLWYKYNIYGFYI